MTDKSQIEDDIRKRGGFRRFLSFTGITRDKRRTTLSLEPRSNTKNEELLKKSEPILPNESIFQSNSSNSLNEDMNATTTTTTTIDKPQEKKLPSPQPIPKSPLRSKSVTAHSNVDPLNRSSLENQSQNAASTSNTNLIHDNPLAALENQMDEATRIKMNENAPNKRQSVFMQFFKPKNVEPEREKQKKKDDNHKSDVEEKIIATTFDELPKEIQKHFIHAKIDLEKLQNPDNWDVICHILCFRFNKRIFAPNSPPRPEKSSSPIIVDGMTIEQCEEKFLTVTEQTPKKIYKSLSPCGKGGYGRVFLGFSSMDKGLKIAVKKVPHTKFKEKRHNFQEIFFVMSSQHPNIVKYIRAHMHNDDLWLIMEFMEGGTLAEAVAAYSFDEKQIAFVAREMVSALHYLHEKNWAHRDLKSSNIMMTIGGEVKLVDFGLCVDLSDGDKTHMCGSPYWMPPEMIRKESHGVLVDVWSLAICLLELANRHPPNYKNPVKAMFVIATTGIRNQLEGGSWSNEFKDFVGLCLVHASKRATTTILKEHEFLKKAATKHVMEKVFRRLFVTSAIMPQGM